MNTTTIPYMPIWSHYWELFSESGLQDAEIGRLVREMMQFYFYGKEPENLPSNLKCVWTLLRGNLISSKAKYLTAVSNGKKGGRPKRARKNPDETQPNPAKPIKEKENKRNENEIKENTDTRSAPSHPVGREGVSGEKHSFGEYGWIKLTREQYQKLAEEMGHEELDKCISYVDEAAQSTGNARRWKDWFLILRRCHRDGWHRESAQRREHPQSIPQGASGHLGEAELEAIRLVLNE